jgi:hypothetical protein
LKVKIPIKKTIESVSRDFWNSGNLFKKILAFPYALLLLAKGKHIDIPGELVWCGKNNYYLTIWKCGNSTIKNPIQKKIGKFVFIPMYKRKKSKELKNNSFIFTFVRNPYKRVLSTYLDKSKNQAMVDYMYHYQGPLKKFNGKKVSFENFVKFLVEIPARKLDVHLKPYSEFTKWVPKLDFVGKLENFEKDWNFVAEKIHFPKAKNIRIVNKNKNGYKLEDYYTPELKELVYQKYKEDFERFGYAK